MANHDSGAQRYNKKMDKIFDRAKAEGRGLVGNSHTDGMGVNSPAMKAARKANMAKKMRKDFTDFSKTPKGKKQLGSLSAKMHREDRAAPGTLSHYEKNKEY